MNCEESDWMDIIPRAPQGSVQSSILFVMYLMNDLPESELLFFADDAKIFREKKTVVKELTCEKDLGVHIDNYLHFDVQRK